MLAQNFKTATDLGFSEQDWLGLQKVLTLLETKQLVRTPAGVPIPNGFNMARVCDQQECGTVACILGWIHLVNGRLTVDEQYIRWLPLSTKEQKLAFADLTMPNGFEFGNYTVEQAATALRSYLTTGQAEWK